MPYFLVSIQRRDFLSVRDNFFHVIVNEQIAFGQQRNEPICSIIIQHN